MAHYDQTKEWNKLLEHLTRGGTYGHYWIKQSARTTWWKVGSPAPVPEGEEDIYFGVHPVSEIPKINAKGVEVPQGKARSRTELIVAVNCLYADFDTKDFGSKEAVTEHIKTLKPFPSVVVDSGGGFHTYWLLDEPILLDGLRERSAALNLQKEWVRHVGADKAVHDLARVLRVPGTKNQKYFHKPQVKIVFSNFSRLFDPSEFNTQGAEGAAETTDAEVPEVPDEGKGAGKEAPALTEKEIREVLANATQAENAKKFARLWNGDTKGYASHSEADEALCCLLAFWVEKDAAKIDAAFRRSGLMRDKWKRTDYRERTIKKAIDQVKEKHSKGLGLKYHCTDMGNAQRLIDRCGQDLRFCKAWNFWLEWDGKRWRKDETDAVVRKAKQTVLSIYGEASEIGGTDEASANSRRALAKHAARSEGEGRVRAMVSLARSGEEVAVRVEKFDQDLWTINVLNGVLDLRTGELGQHRREDYITKLAPVKYVPEARSEKWERFLREVLAQDTREETEGLMRFLQKAIGYSLTGDTSEHAIFLLYGTGANGKSTFLQAVSEVMGDYAMHTPTRTLLAKKFEGIPNDVARLKGARLVTAVESGQGKRMSESLVKQMTGGEKIAARFMRAEWFEFMPAFKIFLATNHRPYIQGTDIAIWRRIRLVPFEVQIPDEEQIKGYFEKVLADELEGIFAWAVQGCLLWQKEGLGKPVVVSEATEQYRIDMDKVERFLKDECVVTREEGDKVKASRLYTTFKGWCEEQGERAFKQTRFGRELTSKGFERIRSNGIWRVGLHLQSAGREKQVEGSGGEEGFRLDLTEV